MTTKKLTGWLLLMDVWETASEVSRVLTASGHKITPQCVCRWQKNGIPRKRRLALVEASNGAIKSVDMLRDKKPIAVSTNKKQVAVSIHAPAKGATYLKGGKILMVVEWTEQGCYKIQSPENKTHGLLFCDFDSSEFEVAGNVFENPELIYPELICA